MGTIINFKREEKLAVLRIMIEISNHYSSSLPNAPEFIQDVTNYFEIPDEIYSLTVSDAQNILGDNLNYDGIKTEFVLDILNYLLKDDKITARYKNIEVKYFKVPINYEEIDKEMNALNNSFKSKWSYAVKLTKKILNLRFIYQNYNPLKKYLPVRQPAINSGTTQQMSVNTIYDDSNSNLRKADIVDKVSDLSFANSEIPKGLIDIIHRMVKKEIGEELIKIREELIDFVCKEIHGELHKGMKDFAQNNFNETLYKDL